MFMGFLQVQMVGNYSRNNFPQRSQNLVLLKLKNIYFLVISSIFQGSPRKVECLKTSHIQSFSVPFPSEPHRKVSADERCLHKKKQLKFNNQLLFKTRFFSEIRVSKNQGLVSGSPPGGLYFQKMTQNKTYFHTK